MRQREKDSIIAQTIKSERVKLSKVICPLCKYGAPLVDGVHPIVIDGELESTGTWVHCLAVRTFRTADDPNNAAPQVTATSGNASHYALPAASAPSSPSDIEESR